MKTSARTPPKQQGKRPAKVAIRRAVASSTAIETGQRIGQLERALRTGNSKYRRLALAR